MATDAEIAVLEALAAQGEMLESKTGTCNPPFRSRLRLVDRQKCLLLLERCSDEPANAALLVLPYADLHIEWGEWQIEFVARNPAAFSHEGTETIRLDFPDTVEIRRRRMYERTPNPQPPLQCVVTSGVNVVFDAAVIDVSLGGIAMESDFGDALAPGMVLTGCRLQYPGSEPTIVDLEVRHAATTRLPDGRAATRAGCRLLNLSPAAMALIAKYVRPIPSEY